MKFGADLILCLFFSTCLAAAQEDDVSGSPEASSSSCLNKTEALQTSTSICPDVNEQLEEEIQAALLLLQEDMENADIGLFLDYYDDEEEGTGGSDAVEDADPILSQDTAGVEDDVQKDLDSDSTKNVSSSKNSTVKEFFATFQNLGVSWGHILRSYQRIIGLAGGGADSEDDVYVTSRNEALNLLLDMTKELAVPESVIKPFSKTRDDLVSAFLTWAVNSNDNNGKHGNGSDNATAKSQTNRKCKGGVNTATQSLLRKTETTNGSTPPLPRINVSKAKRRFEAYAEWMENSAEALHKADGELIPNLLPSRQVFDAFAIRVTRDACGRIVWWMDLDLADEETIRNVLDPHEIRRFFIWFAHFVMYNTNAQENGMVFMNSLAHMAIWEFMTMLPLELGIQTDEFMICVIPLKTKMLAFFNRPAWAKFAFGLLRVFLNRHMRNRVLMVHDGMDNVAKRQKRQRTALQQILGGNVNDYVPQGFVGIDTGRTDTDLLEQFYHEQLQGMRA
jgi:hypothetical protein